MELTKILFAALVVVMWSTALADAATNSSSTSTSLSQTEILVKLLIVPRVNNVTAQVTY